MTTKTDNLVLSNQEKQSLLTISVWSDKWDMPFNISKCKILQMGENREFDYEIWCVGVKSRQCVKDLNVKIPSNPISSQQCIATTNKVNKRWVSLPRTFHSRIKLNTTTRLHSEYAAQFWSSHHTKAMAKLSVQWRAMEMIFLCNKPYEEGCLCMFPIEKCQL